VQARLGYGEGELRERGRRRDPTRRWRALPEAAERIVEDALLVTWRAGVGQEENDSAARLLLLSVLRRSARQMLLARRRPNPTPLDAPDVGQSVERWWSRLPS